MMLTNWIKDHIDKLDKDVEDLRQAPMEEEVESEIGMEDLNFD